jgi:integrase/recombinase XerD
MAVTAALSPSSLPQSSTGLFNAESIFMRTPRSMVASRRCPTLVSKRVTPYVCRHTAAMELLLAGVDRTVIALWLGHESVETTQIYLDANLAMKEEALAKVSPFGKKPKRYKPDDRLLAFLSAL